MILSICLLGLSLVVVGCSTSKANELENDEKDDNSMPKNEINIEDVRQEKTSDYLMASIDYLDASIGDDLLIDEIVKAEKIETGEAFNENKLEVEITLKDGFDDTIKGLALPELILLDLVKNKFNETGKSGVNEVSFKVNAPIDGKVEQVYKTKINKEGYEAIHDGDIDLKRIIENADEHDVHDVYDKDLFKK